MGDRDIWNTICGVWVEKKEYKINLNEYVDNGFAGTDHLIK